MTWLEICKLFLIQFLNYYYVFYINCQYFKWYFESYKNAHYYFLLLLSNWHQLSLCLLWKIAKFHTNHNFYISSSNSLGKNVIALSFKLNLCFIFCQMYFNISIYNIWLKINTTKNKLLKTNWKKQTILVSY